MRWNRVLALVIKFSESCFSVLGIIGLSLLVFWALTYLTKTSLIVGLTYGESSYTLITLPELNVWTSWGLCLLVLWLSVGRPLLSLGGRPFQKLRKEPSNGS